MSVLDYISAWKRKLIDLSRRNRLLYFQQGRSSTLDIDAPGNVAVFQRLVVQELPWKVYIPEPEVPEPGSLFDTSPNESPGDKKLESPLRRPRSDELITSQKEPERIRLILRNLYRRSRSEFEERGVRILYFMFGMLDWKEIEVSESVRSPLLLVPVELRRASVNDPFEFVQVDEDIIVNPALAVKLSTDFDVKLPDPPDDWEESSLEDYLASIQRLVDSYGFRVQRETWIGFASFHKLVIYNDLDKNANIIKDHQIVRLICGEENDPPLPTLCVEEEDLDTTVATESTYPIYDADGSQFACIETVKKGTNLVIQGPPGTGKSQTISNLIAEFIAAGKSVLFVSEKMTALKVVHDRLKRKGLDHFCLEMHSHKANKKDVVAELVKTYQTRLEGRSSFGDHEFQKLADNKSKLVGYVEALHRRRQYLGKSVFEVLGALSSLHDLPFIPVETIDEAAITPNFLDALDFAASRLEDVWDVIREGEEFPWYGCTLAEITIGIRELIFKEVTSVSSNLNRLVLAGQETAKALGYSSPRTETDIRKLVGVLSLLEYGPGIERNWDSLETVSELTKTVQKADIKGKRLLELKQLVNSRFLPSIWEIPNGADNQFGDVCKCISFNLLKRIEDNPTFIQERIRLQAFFVKWDGKFGELTAGSFALSKALAFSTPLTLKCVRDLVQLYRLSSSNRKPDESWIDSNRVSDVANAIADLRGKYQPVQQHRKSILVAYDEAFLRLPHLELIGKFSNAYSSPIKWLIPGYYRQRRILKAVRLDGALPDSILQDLRSALDLNKEEARLAAQKENDRKVLGRLYKGLQTDFDEVGQALEVARKALGLMGISPVSPELRAILSRGGVVPENVRQMGAALSNEVAELEADLKGLEDLVSITKLPQSDVALELSPLEAIDKWVKDCRIFLNSFCSQLEPILLAAQFEGLTCEILQQDLEQISEARRIDEWMTRKEHSLREQIGPKFSGYATLWNELLSALSWAQSFIQLHNGTAIPEPVMQMAVKGHATHSSTAELKALISEYDHSWKILLTRFATGYPRYTSVNLNSLPLGQFQDRLDLMIERVDDIEDWIKFQDIRSAFKQLSADQILESLVHEAAKIGANQLRGVVNKSVLSAWLDKAIAGDPPLRQFRTYEHSKVVEEFRSLDNRLRDASPKRVIEEARRLRPIPSGFINGGEAQILLREGNKQRRLLPIRKLFVQIPMLVKQIKPCLLMSPMSLSQFLEPQSLTFDLVVFDEASQVRPEDAIGAVYRGRQIVVCGDNKQLPPSSFFDVGTAEDEYDDDEENPEAAVDSFESILDDCSKCVPTKMLQWHYRSAHESLIAFSNRRFYQNRLTIFPSSVREDQELGVTFVHVPDGVYTPRRRSERDETRAGTNQKEAEKVVELVAEHIRSHFERSLGVVAFSQSQADAIENSLETYRKTHPEHEEFFGNNRNERFFVNPLEKVQGDERDVMILSVGYARDQYGKFSMNFGPINKQGGERRLNVAVTRARRKLYIVSSVTSADFNLRAGLSAGALLLHKYLDYAERGYKVLETEVGNDDTESPLEDSIAGAVRMLGYEVDCQVGVGGYRIDIGVRDRLLPGRYILGIECDGATYHSSKVSRDRDRLRQEVLEKMGWRIHRIWSTNWVVKRKSEEQRLQSAIEEALKVAQSTYGMRGPLNENVKRDASADPSVTSISVAGELLEGAPDWCTPYEVFSLPRRRRTPLDVNDVKNHTQIRAIILDIVVKEGPVHEEIVLARTCEACGMDRVGGKVRNVFEHIIKKLVKDRELVTGGVFIRARGQTLKAVRTPTDDPESKRLISQIPPEEIQLNLEKITQAAFSIDRQSLIVQVARIFGFDRVGGIIGEVIGGEVDTLLQNGRLVFERGRLSTQK